eukprot:NODE_9241_length_377_cov_30.625000_g8340_i0.p3 GENE.NODE_9241_length_377_cov_30.625000_g8340_i0~~NODE_9241_length_377_cov_30.625000_g8340_i0.p3  ORF type:complete len:66 (-),score=2.84 NODE_9241_length_377_cov_30.625000_g8340_i0:71-268(-)
MTTPPGPASPPSPDGVPGPTWDRTTLADNTDPPLPPTGDRTQGPPAPAHHTGNRAAPGVGCTGNW